MCLFICIIWFLILSHCSHLKCDFRIVNLSSGVGLTIIFLICLAQLFLRSGIGSTTMIQRSLGLPFLSGSLSRGGSISGVWLLLQGQVFLGVLPGGFCHNLFHKMTKGNYRFKLKFICISCHNKMNSMIFLGTHN